MEIQGFEGLSVRECGTYTMRYPKKERVLIGSKKTKKLKVPTMVQFLMNPLFIFIIFFTFINSANASTKEFTDLTITAITKSIINIKGPISSYIGGGATGTSLECSTEHSSQCNGPIIEHMLTAKAGFVDCNGISSMNAINITLPIDSVETSGTYKVTILGTAKITEWDISQGVPILGVSGASFAGSGVFLGCGTDFKQIYNRTPDIWAAAQQATWNGLYLLFNNALSVANLPTSALKLGELFNFLNNLKDTAVLIPTIDYPVAFQLTMETNFTRGFETIIGLVSSAQTLVDALGPIVQLSCMDTGIYIQKVIIEGPVNITDPLISVQPNDLVSDFGDCTIGNSVTKSFTVKNVGSQLLVGNVIAPGGFSVVSGGNYSLNAGETQVVQIRFEPTRIGAYQNFRLTFTGGGDQIIAVIGNGVQPQPFLEVFPSSNIDCGNASITTTTSCSITLANTGKTVLRGNISGLNAPFSTSGSTTYEIDPGAYKQINIAFSPTEVKSYSSTLFFSGGIDTVSRLITGKGLGDIRNVTVSSLNPNSGASIKVTPVDVYNRGSDTTQFTRTYRDGTPVSFDASTPVSGGSFKQWLRNGTYYWASQTVQFNIVDSVQLTAEYITPPATTRLLTVSSSNPNSGVLLISVHPESPVFKEG